MRESDRYNQSGKEEIGEREKEKGKERYRDGDRQ